MAIPEREQIKTKLEGLEWIVCDDHSLTLLNTTTGETYHSGCGAVAETCVVYLKNSGLMDRALRNLESRILEYGLGTGTAFLLSASLAQATGTRLEYTAIENDFRACALVEQLSLAERAQEYLANNQDGIDAIERWQIELEELCTKFVELSKTLTGAAPTPQLQTWELSECVTLQLWPWDAREFPVSSFHAYFDVVFFDPFSPATNPELWQSDVFEGTFQMLKSRGKLTSYCVKGDIRRSLQAEGFLVQKLTGPQHGKREVLCCERP